MNLKSTLYAMGVALALNACTSDAVSDLQPEQAGKTASRGGTTVDTDLFARKNGEIALTGAFTNPDDYRNYYNDPVVAEHVCKLLQVCDTAFAGELNRVEVQPQHLREIRNFVSTEILKPEMTTQYQKMMAILEWLNTNIRHENGDNDAYSVFINRYGVCQGYANLMTAMLHTQGIKATNVNGFLGGTGGHAWNYVLADGHWYVVDPTNERRAYRMVEDLENYRKHLQPWTVDMPLHRDEDFVYDFREKHFNIRAVLNGSEREQVSVPYGALGYRLTAFDPIGGIEGTVKEIYLSLNIQSVGPYVLGLSRYGSDLEAIHVWNEKNHMINDYDGCLYSVSYNAATQETTFLKPLYVPGAKREMRYAPMPVAASKALPEARSLEVLRYDASTLTFEDYLVENAPNLKEVHINKNATVSPQAFNGLPAGCQIVRYDPLDTGIREVRR